MGLILLLPATLLCVPAYVVMYLAGRSEGGMRTFGKILGGWIFVIAAILAVAALSSPFFGGRPFGMAPRMHMMHGPMGGEMMRPMGPPPGAPAPEAAPAPPPR